MLRKETWEGGHGLLYRKVKQQSCGCFCVKGKAMALQGPRSSLWLGESLEIRQEHARTDSQLSQGCSD